MSLKTTYIDSVYTQKEYQMTQQTSGYVSLEDITTYSQEGDYYGCEDLNKQNNEYNKVSNDFDNIQGLISRLNYYGITVSNNPSSIENAINSLAATKYSAGRNSGISYVQNHATTYGLRTSAEYGTLTNKVQTALNAMLTAISYINIINPITGSFSDPITSSEASSFKSSANSAIDGARTPFTTFKNTAINLINTAVNALNV